MALLIQRVYGRIICIISSTLAASESIQTFVWRPHLDPKAGMIGWFSAWYSAVNGSKTTTSDHCTG